MLKRAFIVGSALLFSFLASAADDVRLIIDISGSMKQNDPDNLRIPAVNLLIKLAPAGSNGGVWTFGQDVNMLVPHGEVTTSWRQDAIDKTAQINSSGLFTNIGAALEEVILDYPAGDAAILLTDGVVDISKDPAVNNRERKRILDQILPRLIDKGVIVHSVALSNNTDEALLNELSKSTGGMFEVARSSADLMTIFLKMFDDAVPQDQIPLTGNEFLVDKSVQEFTLRVFKQPEEPPVQLRSPDDQYHIAAKHPGYISWYSDVGYDLITVSEPTPGSWKLFAETDDQNRVTVLSDLRLEVTNLENTIYPGQIPEFNVSFQQEGRRVINRKFLALMDVQLILTAPDGVKRGTRLSEFHSGLFGAPLKLFDQTGKYQLKVSVDGKSFKREVVQEIEYQHPVTIRVDQSTRSLMVVPVIKSLLKDDLSIIASLGSASLPTRLLPMIADKQGFWAASLESFADGTYALNLNVSGVTGRGQTIDFKIEGDVVELKPRVSPDTMSPGTDSSGTGAVTELAEATQDKMATEPVPSNPEDSDSVMSYLKGIVSNSYFVYGMVALVNLLALTLGFLIFQRRNKVSIDDPELAALLSSGAEDTEVLETTVVLEDAAVAEVEADDPVVETRDGISDIVDGWTAIEEDQTPGSAEVETPDAPGQQQLVAQERAEEEAEIAKILAEDSVTPQDKISEQTPETTGNEELDLDLELDVNSIASNDASSDTSGETSYDKSLDLAAPTDAELDIASEAPVDAASVEDADANPDLDLAEGLDGNLDESLDKSPEKSLEKSADESLNAQLDDGAGKREGDNPDEELAKTLEISLEGASGETSEDEPEIVPGAKLEVQQEEAGKRPEA